jgi:hypothetical protein
MAETTEKRGPGRPRKPRSQTPEPIGDTQTIESMAIPNQASPQEVLMTEPPQMETEPRQKRGTVPYDCKPGMIVPPGTIPPFGWQLVPMENGTLELWPMLMEDFNPTLTADTLKKLDAAWERTLPTDENPDKERPVILAVNKAFRSIIRTTAAWGDEATCRVQVVTDPDVLDQGDQPAFKFMTESEASKLEVI